ncbi:hypothetical protein EI983_12390 [Roseovarius faecimaris]|uniref:Uncharacterized protein n=2 Tax=Roseovarius faecimaris TaxID=2494550 RepID=A0A6I6ISB4_9RHOB|nr:hypothetical protein EI983_12390 [Roseovarius faecimaris]
MVAALTATSACVELSGIETPPVTFTYSKDFDQSRLVPGMTRAFRTYAPPESASKSAGDEIKGAQCTMKSKELEASFVTPALIDMPTIRGKPSALEVTCRANGKSVTRVQEPFKPHTIIVGDPVSMLVSNIVTAAVTAGSDKWSYTSSDSHIAFIMD